jgi:hypothetical protein
MATKFDLISAASTRTGNDPVTSFTDGTTEANIAAANYQILVDAELSKYRWHFATKFEVMNVLDADVHGDPPEPWLYSYQLPDDVWELRTVKSGGEPIAYEKMRNKVFADVGTEAAVYAHYLWRVPESSWPPYFQEYIVQRLEALFLRGIGERYDEAEARKKEALNVTLPEAKRMDAQSQTPVNPVRSPTLDARRGVVAIGARLPWR